MSGNVGVSFRVVDCVNLVELTFVNFKGCRFFRGVVNDPLGIMFCNTLLRNLKSELTLMPLFISDVFIDKLFFL